MKTLRHFAVLLAVAATWALVSPSFAAEIEANDLPLLHGAIVLIDDAGFGSSTAFGSYRQDIPTSSYVR